MPGTIGLGTTLFVDDGGGNSFVAIPDVVSIDPPAEEIQIAESKRLDLTNNGLIGKVVATRDGGTWSFTYEYTNTLYARIEALKGLSKNFRITPNGGTQRSTPGIVTQNKQNEIAADGIMTCTATVTVNGPTT
jgi:hypothetical protein